MIEDKRNFFTTTYAEVPKARIAFYMILVAFCFGVVGLITGEIRISTIGGCAAILFIHLLGKWCDYSRSNPTTMQWISAIYCIVSYIIAFIVLIGIADHYLGKYIW